MPKQSQYSLSNHPDHKYEDQRAMIATRFLSLHTATNMRMVFV